MPPMPEMKTKRRMPPNPRKTGPGQNPKVAMPEHVETGLERQIHINVVRAALGGMVDGTLRLWLPAIGARCANAIVHASVEQLVGLASRQWVRFWNFPSAHCAKIALDVTRELGRRDRLDQVWVVYTMVKRKPFVWVVRSDGKPKILVNGGLCNFLDCSELYEHTAAQLGLTGILAPKSLALVENPSL